MDGTMLRRFGLGALLATVLVMGTLPGLPSEVAHAEDGEIDFPGPGSAYPVDEPTSDEIDCWFQYWHPFCQYQDDSE